MKADHALTLALRFHETYERLAPQYGYKTQIATRTFDPDSANGKLMIAVCAEVAREILQKGVAIGLEEAITACDREREIYQLGPPGSLQNDAQQKARSACWGCAAAIRAIK